MKKIMLAGLTMVLTLGVTNSSVLAQDASPSSTPSPSASASASSTPSPSPSVSPSPSASSGTGGVTVTPTPSASASGDVLGGTTTLAETSSIKTWVLYGLSGAVIFAVVIYGLKLVRTAHVEE